MTEISNHRKKELKDINLRISESNLPFNTQLKLIKYVISLINLNSYELNEKFNTKFLKEINECESSNSKYRFNSNKYSPKRKRVIDLKKQEITQSTLKNEDKIKLIEYIDNLTSLPTFNIEKFNNNINVMFKKLTSFSNESNKYSTENTEEDFITSVIGMNIEKQKNKNIILKNEFELDSNIDESIINNAKEKINNSDLPISKKENLINYVNNLNKQKNLDKNAFNKRYNRKFNRIKIETTHTKPISETDRKIIHEPKSNPKTEIKGIYDKNNNPKFKIDIDKYSPNRKKEIINKILIINNSKLSNNKKDEILNDLYFLTYNKNFDTEYFNNKFKLKFNQLLKNQNLKNFGSNDTKSDFKRENKTKKKFNQQFEKVQKTDFQNKSKLQNYKLKVQIASINNKRKKELLNYLNECELKDNFDEIQFKKNFIYAILNSPKIKKIQYILEPSSINYTKKREIYTFLYKKIEEGIEDIESELKNNYSTEYKTMLNDEKNRPQFKFSESQREVIKNKKLMIKESNLSNKDKKKLYNIIKDFKKNKSFNVTDFSNTLDYEYEILNQKEPNKIQIDLSSFKSLINKSSLTINQKNELINFIKENEIKKDLNMKKFQKNFMLKFKLSIKNSPQGKYASKNIKNPFENEELNNFLFEEILNGTEIEKFKRKFKRKFIDDGNI